MRKFVLFLVVVSLIGCATMPLRQRNAKFIEEEYAPYNKNGTGTITGQAFLKTRGGDVKYAAGTIIHLNPATSYLNEEIEIWVKAGIPLEPYDPRIMKYHRDTIGDGEGRFEFKDLPSGEYYITSPIYWEVPSQYGLTQTGGIVYSKVRLEEGKVIKVIVTR